MSGAGERDGRARKEKKRKRKTQEAAHGLLLGGKEFTEGAGGRAEVMAFAPDDAERAMEGLVRDADGADVLAACERKLGHEGHAEAGGDKFERARHRAAIECDFRLEPGAAARGQRHFTQAITFWK